MPRASTLGRCCATMAVVWSVGDYRRVLKVKTWRRMAVGTAAMGLVVVGVGATPIEAGSKVDRVVVKGDVDTRLKLSADDIEQHYKQYDIQVTFQAGTTPQTHTYHGALLYDIINSAHPDF